MRSTQLNLASARKMNVGYNERMVSVIGGPLVALYGLSRGSLGGLLLAAAGGEMLYRGLSGHCPVYQALGVSTARQQDGPLQVEHSVTINRPAEELYRYWRDFANLPRFMKHLESVRVDGDDCSHWVARAPAGTTVEWDAEITADQPSQLIAWRSLPGADVDSVGEVRFEPAPGQRGTVVRVSLSYSPPAGAVGAAVAKLFGEEPGQQIAGDLRRFKNIAEAGEIPTTEGQPSGKRSAIGALLKPEHKPAGADDAARIADTQQGQPQKPIQPKKPPVTQASEESFPASDAPSWTGTGSGGLEREAGA